MSSNKLILAAKTPPDVYNVDQPWQRQPFDGDTEWAAFRVWLTAPIPRQPSWLARMQGLPLYEINMWRAKYHWDARAAAFDNYAHQHFQDTVIEVLTGHGEDYANRHAKLIEQATDLLSNELRKFLEASQSTEMTTISPSELIKLLDSTVKLDRLVKGEHTEHVKQDVDLTGLSPDDLIRLKELQSKVGLR